MLSRLAIAAALACSPPAYSAAPSQSDWLALEELASRMDREWTRADADASARLFAPNASARFGEDPLADGRDAIRAQFREFFKDRPPALRHVTKIERIEEINADHALWDAEVRVEREQADGTWQVLTRIRNVTVAVRGREGWRVLAVRAVPVRS